MIAFFQRPGRQFLVMLPAVMAFCITLSLREAAWGQAASHEPQVLIGDEAEAFVVALAPDMAPPLAARAVDVVLLVRAPGSAHLVLVDIEGGRKLWALVPLRLLGRILARMGEGA